MKTGWMAALCLLAAPVWAQPANSISISGGAGGGNVGTAQSPIVRDTRPVVGEHEEMLWRACQKEPLRLQSGADASENSACKQLAESQQRRGYVAPVFDPQTGGWRYH